MCSPIPLLTAQQMRDCDTYTIQVGGVPSAVLMERAAAAAVALLQSCPATRPLAGREVVVLCGSGNNGGDGFAMARLLRGEGCEVCVAYGGAWDAERQCPLRERMSVECARQYARWQAAGGVTLSELPPLLKERQVVVDALLGTDLHGAPRPPMDAWIAAVNQSGCPVLAVDVPSGVDATTGAVFADGVPQMGVDGDTLRNACAVRATLTATMAYPKRGLLLYPAAAFVGQLCICDIGIDTEGTTPDTYLLRREHLSLLPARPRYANKGSFGRVAVIGGACGMCGAVCFAATAALRVGVGLVELVSCEQNRIPLQTLLPEAIMTVLPDAAEETDVLREVLARADVAVVGCGMGRSAAARRQLLGLVAEATCPLVLDADALNLLAEDGDGALSAALRSTARRTAVVITPHLGEAARLLGVGIGALREDLCAAAAALARAYGVVCVLKDARTVISDGSVTYLQDCGCSALAKGGTGDCLAGVIGGLLCLCRNGDEANTATRTAALGVLLHAAAGDAAAADMGENAPLAREIADYVGSVLRDAVRR